MEDVEQLFRMPIRLPRDKEGRHAMAETNSPRKPQDRRPETHPAGG